MTTLLLGKGLFPKALMGKAVAYIQSQQLSDGAIPWFKGHFADPWDHVEAAMGLTIGGQFEAAQNAYRWLAQHQLEDGTWWAEYRYDPQTQQHIPNTERLRETNFIAYLATGVWHYYLVTGDRLFLHELYPNIKKAINAVVAQQSPTGEVYWAINTRGESQKDALVTACSSIYKSLECAINCAAILGEVQPTWRDAYRQLGHTLRHKPERFDRTWESKARFSMDWFYPVLTGAFEGAAARARLQERWDTFVENGLGCRCVSDEPWVTIAESCELTLALLAAGEHGRAVQVYSWLHQFMDESDGGYWTGYVFPDKALWPEEKTTWTCGAILLAADALTEHTGASKLFLEKNLLSIPESDVIPASHNQANKD
ncbi:prenyltransferase [Marinibactrum halimedae]|uniref:Prenyltransferase n=1 Tax=Marinibactrum halimedae TaxID=1444977 RepID=A0AA37TAR1_9GAMM|nr:prenyltransferase [Marinibactrum halimedae]MCD9459327.1 prenyltransferase [Marinibactrum halimedae]GLS25782.1 prenyltransferase [Marinibactrum halimedae]